MIHLLAWAAVTLTAAHSYNHRFDPTLIAARKEHRMELPAFGFAFIMLVVLMFLISATGVGGASEPASLPEPRVIWVPVT